MSSLLASLDNIFSEVYSPTLPTTPPTTPSSTTSEAGSASTHDSMPALEDDTGHFIEVPNSVGMCWEPTSPETHILAISDPTATDGTGNLETVVFCVDGEAEQADCGPLGDLPDLDIEPRDQDVIDEPELAQHVLWVKAPADPVGAAHFLAACEKLEEIQSYVLRNTGVLGPRHSGVVWRTPNNTPLLMLASPLFRAVYTPGAGFDYTPIRLKVYNRSGELFDPNHVNWCLKNSTFRVYFTLHHSCYQGRDIVRGMLKQVKIIR
ncbi:hypothetical protein BDN72DRAFT_874659 [Pluteus cervinus]|uniref:Uncharacterized protein n=1 Tax=Pluteus cervinus TaxID=181527 RepID=A0ACD3BBH5_9AGAR|nr:hypothetical protein BDN72DRAFT_874659 [Pluteus cervinus]